MTAKPQPVSEVPRVLSLSADQVAVLSDALNSYFRDLQRWCGDALSEEEAAREQGRYPGIATAKYESLRRSRDQVRDLERALLEAHKVATASPAVAYAPAAPLEALALNRGGTSVAAPAQTSDIAATPCAASEEPGRGGRDSDPVPSPAAAQVGGRGRDEAGLGSPAPASPTTEAASSCGVCGHAPHELDETCFRANGGLNGGPCICDGRWHFFCVPLCLADFDTVEALTEHSKGCLEVAISEDALVDQGHLDPSARQTPSPGEGWRATISCPRWIQLTDRIGAPCPDCGGPARAHVATAEVLDMLLYTWPQLEPKPKQGPRVRAAYRQLQKADKRRSRSFRQLRKLALVLERDGATPEAWFRLQRALTESAPLVECVHGDGSSHVLVPDRLGIQRPCVLSTPQS